MVRIITFSGTRASASSIATTIATVNNTARVRRRSSKLEVDEGRATEGSEQEDRVETKQVEECLRPDRRLPPEVEVVLRVLNALHDDEGRGVESDRAQAPQRVQVERAEEQRAR